MEILGRNGGHVGEGNLRDMLVLCRDILLLMSENTSREREEASLKRSVQIRERQKQSPND